MDNLIGKAARELGIKLPEGYRDPRKRELKLKGQEIIRNQEMYDKITTPVPVRKA